MTYTATYSPEDNKLRLYASSRLDKELYLQVKSHGFKWAPKQELFVAPMWTPSREDFLLSLCDEIGDEDTSLVDRAEIRAERFEDYSEKREAEAERAHDYVSSITDNIPFGQPILVGHHSERRARRDAEKIENGMRRAVKLWDTSKYWTMRAKGAIRHAKYKERADVRARRVKGLEADKRKFERNRAEAEKWLRLWSKEGLTQEEGTAIANRCWLHLPRKEGDKPDFNQKPTAYDALNNSYPSLYAPRTLAEIVDVAKKSYPRTIQYCDRWISHIDNRLAYERAMLDEAGYTAPVKPRKVELPICNYRQPQFIVPNRYQRGEFMTLSQIEMTRAEYARIYTDYKGTSPCENSHRIRIAIVKGDRVAVFLTDSKVHQKPEPIDPPEPEYRPTPDPTPRSYAEPEPTKFDALKETLKAGVQVVSAPQLFPTPKELAERIAIQADIRLGHRVLEPSAGTGNLLFEIMKRTEPTNTIAVEINPQLCAGLRQRFTPCPFQILNSDFLTHNGDLGKFDRIVMNPPFVNGEDIKHITHAMSFLMPGGRLVALCANGPRQRDQLKPLADEWEDLPAGSFSEKGTNVNVALLVINGPAAGRLF